MIVRSLLLAGASLQVQINIQSVKILLLPSKVEIIFVTLKKW